MYLIILNLYLFYLYQFLIDKITKDIKESFGLDYQKFVLNSVSVDEYIRCLFDLKRSGDYLTVAAAAEANRRSQDGKLYVFVSMDAFAVLRACFLGVPSVRAVNTSSKNMSFYKMSNYGKTLFPEIYNDSIHRFLRKTVADQRIPRSIHDESQIIPLTRKSRPKPRRTPTPAPTPMTTRSATASATVTRMSETITDSVIRSLNTSGTTINSIIKKTEQDSPFLRDSILSTLYMNDNIKKLNKNALKKVTNYVEKYRIPLTPLMPGGTNDRVQQQQIKRTSTRENSLKRSSVRRPPSRYNTYQNGSPMLFVEHNIIDILELFNETHPLYRLLYAFLHVGVKKINTFQYLLYRFICYYSDDSENKDIVQESESYDIIFNYLLEKNN